MRRLPRQPRVDLIPHGRVDRSEQITPPIGKEHLNRHITKQKPPFRDAQDLVPSPAARHLIYAVLALASVAWLGTRDDDREGITWCQVVLPGGSRAERVVKRVRWSLSVFGVSLSCVSIHSCQNHHHRYHNHHHPLQQPPYPLPRHLCFEHRASASCAWLLGPQTLSLLKLSQFRHNERRQLLLERRRYGYLPPATIPLLTLCRQIRRRCRRWRSSFLPRLSRTSPESPTSSLQTNLCL